MRRKGRLAGTAVSAFALAFALASAGAGPASADEAPPGAIERTYFPLRPGDTGALVSLLQQRLAWLGSPIDAAEQGTLGPTTMAALADFQTTFAYRQTPDVPKPTWDALARTVPVPGALPSSCRTGTVICIDKTQRILRLVRDGKVTLSADARFGLESGPTRTGIFRVRLRALEHTSTLTGTAMPYSLFFSGGQAIHYSAAFARDGYAGASLGCVNLRDRKAAARLFAAAPVGTPVVIVPGPAR